MEPQEPLSQQDSGADKKQAADSPLGEETPRGPSYQPLVVVLAALSAGIVADRYAGPGWTFWMVLGLAGWGGWAWCWVWRWDGVAGVLILSATAAVGGAWHHLWWNRFSPWEIARYAAMATGYADSETLPEADPEMPTEAWAKPVALEAIVKSSPYELSRSNVPPWRQLKGERAFRFEAEVCRIRHGLEWRPAAGRIIVRVKAKQLEEVAGKFGLGDRIRIFGQLGRIMPPANPGEYDFAEVARGSRVLCMVGCCCPECIEPIEAAAWWHPGRLVDTIRRQGAQRFADFIGNPGGPLRSSASEPPEGQEAKPDGTVSRARLAATMLLGLREELPPEYTEPFVRTGTVHLLVISGFHVGLIVLIVSWGGRLVGVSRSMEILIIAAVSLGYMVLSGARAPTVRATVLVELGCLAALVGRNPLGLNTLGAAGIVILAFNPTQLFRIGVQLSFLSVAALFIFLPENRIPRRTTLKVPEGSSLSATRWTKWFEKLFARNLQAVEGRETFWHIVRRWKDYVWTWLGPLDGADPLDRLIAKRMSRPERWIRWCVRAVGYLFASGAVIWVVVVPLVMARMHLLPLAGLWLHVLVWPTMLGFMISGFAFLTIGWVWAPLGRLLAGLCDLCLDGLAETIGWAASLPGSYHWTPGPAGWWLVGFYGGLAAWLVYFRYRAKARWAIGALALWIAVGLFGPGLVHRLTPSEPGSWECTFLSVGHGLAVVAHLPDGQTWLYDAGSLAVPEKAAEIIAGYLWSRRITCLDTVFLSHADSDHINALPGVLERIHVRRIVTSSCMDRHDSAASLSKRPSSQARNPISEHLEGKHISDWKSIKGLCEEKRIPIFQVHAPGEEQVAPGIRIVVFHPPEGGVPGNDNANSLVLGIEAHGRRVLLTGDLEPPGIAYLLSQPAWRCDLVLVPHHGSRTSQPAQLASWCQADWAVISGGRVLETTKAEAAYRSAGATVWHTGRHGAVFARFSPERVGVQSHWYPAASPALAP